MKAIVFQEKKNFDSLKIKEVPDPQPGPGEVVVEVKASALNHRDVWIIQGLYAGIKTPIILGSDGAGVVKEVGDGVDSGWIGQEVIINPSLDWGENPRVQGKNYRILGLPDNGTQAELVKVPSVNIVPKPRYLSFPEAAAIPLAGLTGYRALFTQGKLKCGETVLLTGIGGGVAALMFQMALAAGARVLVTSGSDEKLERAVQSGAAGGANYRNEEWAKEIQQLAGERGIDLIVDSAGGDGFDHLINLVNPGGRICFFGATRGNPSTLTLRRIFWKQLTIQGTTMGSPQDFYEMVRLFEQHQIHPIIDGPYTFEDYRTAYQRMMDGAQFGKIVITLE
ncbi:MAG: alcohol dehydrogenase [Calditrichaeota bacterium]|nr:MAG: alcohol dehydrogenase [Calditrichota bacterium]